jgi:hypothetical protein
MGRMEENQVVFTKVCKLIFGWEVNKSIISFEEELFLSKNNPSSQDFLGNQN